MLLKNMVSKEKYIAWSNNQKKLPVFMQPWWLKAASYPFDWEAIVIENGNNIIAALPFTIRKKMGFNLIRNPHLTPFLNLCIDFPKDLSKQNRLTFQKEVINKILSNLPSYHDLQIRLHPDLQYPLPFSWKGFKIDVRFTNQLTLSHRLDDIHQHFKPSLKRNLKKAEKIVTINESNNAEEFYKLFSMTFSRQKKPTPYKLKTFLKINDACHQQKSRKILIAKDKNNNIHAGIYLVWDKEFVYYLMGGSNPLFRNSQAISLLIWNAIQFAHKEKKSFDFEGSMIEPIERFFRSFGSSPKTYFQIKKSNSLLFKFRELINI